MTKSMSRDVSVLMYIRKNRNKIIQAMSYCNCSVNTLSSNTVCFDVCSMYLAQIGENVKLLTDGSAEYLNNYINVRGLKQLRNQIDHVYQKVSKQNICLYVSYVLSKDFADALNYRISYCMQNKRS